MRARPQEIRSCGRDRAPDPACDLPNRRHQAVPRLSIVRITVRRRTPSSRWAVGGRAAYCRPFANVALQVRGAFIIITPDSSQSPVNGRTRTRRRAARGAEPGARRLTRRAGRPAGAALDAVSDHGPAHRPGDGQRRIAHVVRNLVLQAENRHGALLRAVHHGQTARVAVSGEPDEEEPRVGLHAEEGGRPGWLLCFAPRAAAATLDAGPDDVPFRVA